VPETEPESVVSLEGARLRQNPPSEQEVLRCVLATHGEIVAAGLDLHRLVDVITRRAQELTRSEGAVLEVIDGDELVYWSASGSGSPFLGLRVSAARSLSGLAAAQNAVLVCDDSETDPRVDRDMCRRVGLRSMITAPLPYNGTVIGVLKVMSPWAKAYSPRDVDVLSQLNVLIGAAIAHAVTHRELAEQMSVATAAKYEGDELDDDLAHERLVRRRIRSVIDNGEFRVVYQPVCNLQTGGLVGHEALARFTDDRSPDVWFADAREAGLAPELELAVVRKALDVFDRWKFPTYLAVNFSPATIMRPELETLCRTFDGSRLVIEMTEHSQVEDYALLADCVNRLRRLGPRFAVDDAGAGFASLRHVLRIRPDFIKLDRSITQGIDSKPAHQALISALLTFAEGTSLAIVAEGIETAAEAATLRRLGVTYGQGYYLGRPGRPSF
jgi:EAL domain-containing protein (putative c-di-GMP-specific phosphodiesterase class I)